MEQMEYQDAYGMDLCKVCGRRTIDRSTGNPHEFMCRECRQEIIVAQSGNSDDTQRNSYEQVFCFHQKS